MTQLLLSRLVPAAEEDRNTLCKYIFPDIDPSDRRGVGELYGADETKTSIDEEEEKEEKSLEVELDASESLVEQSSPVVSLL